MGAMSAAHWLIVFVVVLLVFGPKRLAGVGRSLGEGLRSLREGLGGDENPGEPGTRPPPPDGR